MEPLTKRRIFVVDDDAFVAHAVALVLRNAGFEVSAFDDPVSAAQRALQSAPDVVITDYSMPQITGLMLTAWLREHCPECKIILLTGQAAALSEHTIAGLNYTLLQKPVAPSVLIEAVID